MKWELRWSNCAIKDIKKLDESVKKTVWESLNSLVQQPESADIKKLKGTPSEYRLRIGDWRVRFQVDFTNKIYLITHVKHRKDIYK